MYVYFIISFSQVHKRFIQFAETPTSLQELLKQKDLKTSKPYDWAKFSQDRLKWCTFDNLKSNYEGYKHYENPLSISLVLILFK